MFERFTGGARDTVAQVQEHARRLGHRYIGCEHLLLAAAATGEPASAALREQGVTPDAVEAQIARLAGLGQAADLFSTLDRAALASIGIDLDAVRGRIEAGVRAGRAHPGGPGHLPQQAACGAEEPAGPAAPSAPRGARSAGQPGRAHHRAHPIHAPGEKEPGALLARSEGAA